MRILQLTLGSGATAISPNLNSTSSEQIYVSLLVIGNASGHTIRIGDSSVTSTTGIGLATGSPGTPLVLNFETIRGSLLSSWYILGTSGEKVDILYETAQ